MKIIADFHIHSKYSRATSHDMDLEHIFQSAQEKGITVVGTGDFTHPEWFNELKNKLEPAEEGLYKLKNQNEKIKSNGEIKDDIRFVVTGEISNIYTRAGKGRRVHNLIVLPSLESAEKINNILSWQGNLKSDGRPILGMDSEELLKIVMKAEPNALFIPAHCLLPDTYLHSNLGIKKIKDISVGDKVYTHKGRLKKVKQIHNRFYRGPIYNIRPYYFRIGLKTTEEHPFYVIKTYKKCLNMGHSICKSDCAYIKRRNCPHQYFENYKCQWIQAKDIKKGDVLIFPRFNKEIKDRKELNITKFFKKDDYKVDGKHILLNHSRAKKLPKFVRIDKDFCRLIGYYVSEGYTDNKDSISFCFNRDEKKYVEDLKFLMEKAFNLSSSRIYLRKNTNSIEIIYCSKILAKVFSKLFYNNANIRRANTKCLPIWMMGLPLEKQVEIFKGWWRGDKGTTSSRELMNQIKIILLRLGIIPSIYEQTKEDFNEKYVHKYKLGNRIIEAQHNSFSFNNLSFFQDLFGLLKDSEFKKFNTKLARRHGWIDKNYIYLPVRDIEIKNYKGKVYNLEVEEDNTYLSEFATIHNCMTPWFGIFGSMSGFDSLKEAFGENTKYIYALETGLSADPKMVWRIPDGQKVSLISNSDAHSPHNLGREANVFNTDLSYSAMREAIIKKDKSKFLYTIEFFPEEGKYHYDGHRLCQVRMSPEQRKKAGGICPKCGRKLTIGVLSRIDELADKKEDFIPRDAIPYKSLVPLAEIIAEALNVQPLTKAVAEHYQRLIQRFSNEFNILLDVPLSELSALTLPEIVAGIEKVRKGKLIIEPGYDGEFGKVRIFPEKREEIISQSKLF
jgi:uncharacterized protein (TIGR00375 family)